MHPKASFAKTAKFGANARQQESCSAPLQKPLNFVLAFPGATGFAGGNKLLF
jgi:hypothetical protein